jgi:hypothetical protein
MTIGEEELSAFWSKTAALSAALGSSSETRARSSFDRVAILEPCSLNEAKDPELLFPRRFIA